MNQTIIAQAARMYGIHAVAEGIQPQFIPENMAHLAMDADLAMDALPSLISVSNGGVPAFLTSFVDPKLIEVVVAPMKAAQIIGENKKGDWTSTTTLFPVIESAGEVSSYDDYSNNGVVTANVNWPQRQSYHYQAVTMWGERQLAQMGTGRIDWANRLSISSALIMNKFQNKTYFFGVTGLQNYGLLNDPNLNTPITPLTKAAGGFTWANATALEIFADALALFGQLQAQLLGNLEQDAKMVLALSPAMMVNLAKLTPFNVPVIKMLKDAFPNLRIETAVEYATASGQLVQLIVEQVDGQEVAYGAFTEKMRAHPVVIDLSAFKQKKSGGTWGAIILMPVAIAGLLGV